MQTDKDSLRWEVERLQLDKPLPIQGRTLGLVSVILLDLVVILFVVTMIRIAVGLLWR